MYSPHLATLIAQVVMKDPLIPIGVEVIVGRGGGEEQMQKSRVGVWELVPWRASRPGLRGTKALGPEGPLDLPLQEELASACKDYLDFVGSHPFSNESFLEGARLGTLVLEKAGHWEEANRAIRKVWVELKGDHFQDLHGDFFEGLVADDVLERARANARWGIEARYEGAQGERVRCGPHPSLKEHFEEAATQLWADAGKGRALLCYDHGQRELSGVISVALARVPKMNPDRSVSEKGSQAHPLVATSVPRDGRVAGEKDVAEAFKWVPVRSSDTRLFAADLPESEFGASGKTITVMYNSLTFGWTGAPGEYMMFAWVAKLAHAAHAPQDGLWNDSVSFKSLVLMDDSILIEPDIGVRPWLSVQTCETCTKKALGPGTINEVKDEVEGALEATKLIWGLMYKGQRSERRAMSKEVAGEAERVTFSECIADGPVPVPDKTTFPKWQAKEGRRPVRKRDGRGMRTDEEVALWKAIMVEYYGEEDSEEDDDEEDEESSDLDRVTLKAEIIQEAYDRVGTWEVRALVRTLRDQFAFVALDPNLSDEDKTLKAEALGQVILGLGGKESSKSDKLFSTPSVEGPVLDSPTREAVSLKELGRAGLAKHSTDGGNSPLHAKVAALEMELEALKRGSDGSVAGGEAQTKMLQETLMAKGGVTSVTSVITDVNWPTLTDDRSEARDVAQFYEEFEDCCSLANNCKGMSFREQLIALRARCRGSRLKTFTNIYRAAERGNLDES
ncbi:Uncharacterized protein SCF082_LOCUS11888 [Durusdinium trenchii]|uniref:Uncharacterized protein n=1 Tax=Durusdinium trenchii TaxID=1381693 RepID=A0ABP0JG51_9DINO